MNLYRFNHCNYSTLTVSRRALCFLGCRFKLYYGTFLISRSNKILKHSSSGKSLKSDFCSKAMFFDTSASLFQKSTANFFRKSNILVSCANRFFCVHVACFIRSK